MPNLVKIYFEHWRTGEELQEEGSLPVELNRPASDRYVLKRRNGTFVDILKKTVQKIENITI